MKKTILLIGALWLAGCATMAGLSQKPEVSLAGVELAEIGLLEQRFLLRLRLRNPNDVAMNIDGMNYTVELNGQPFARGGSGKRVSIPRQGESVIEVDAVSDLSGIFRQLRELARGGREAVAYRVRGEVGVDGLGKVPFERSGEIPIPALPGVRPAGSAT